MFFIDIVELVWVECGVVRRYGNEQGVVGVKYLVGEYLELFVSDIVSVNIFFVVEVNVEFFKFYFVFSFEVQRFERVVEDVFMVN